MLSCVSSSWPAVYSAEFFGVEAANDCTPPAEPAPLPSVEAGLVAQSSVGGGECIPFAGPWRAHRPASDLRDDAFPGWLSPEWACGGMDAPRDPPIGAHRAYVSCPGTRCAQVYADGYDCRPGC